MPYSNSFCWRIIQMQLPYFRNVRNKNHCTYTLESVPAIPRTIQLVATSFIWWNIRWFADSLIIWPFLGQSAQFHSISGHFFVWDPRVFEAEMGVLCAVWRVSEIRGGQKWALLVLQIWLRNHQIWRYFEY